VNERPENAEVGAEIFTAEILPGQLEDHPPPLEEVSYKKQGNSQVVHGVGYYWESPVK